jgi:putative IMPACT (imprinted ancient) family translation regulator
LDAFRTLAGPVEAEIREKGSRFLARAVPVTGRAAAEQWCAEQAHAYRDATHVVPAFRLHDGTEYASDAGEPTSAAGPPMLQALRGAGLHDVAAVVVRWYGGTNLGIGGLVRAYSGALALALADAAVRAATPGVRLEVRHDHDRTSAVLRTVAAFGGRDLERSYAEDVTCSFVLPAAAAARFRDALRDATAGAVDAVETGSAVIYGA